MDAEAIFKICTAELAGEWASQGLPDVVIRRTLDKLREGFDRDAAKIAALVRCSIQPSPGSLR
jgi:hypothetical protein